MRIKLASSELRKTGISIIGDIPWGAHLCHFYETKDDLLDVLIPYFKAGLENNEFCIWVVADPLSEEQARNALRQAMPEADQYLTAGRIEIVPHTLFPTLRQRTPLGEQIEIIPHTDWYLKDGAFVAERVLDGWKQKLEEALAKGYAGLRANGNEAWLTAENWKAFAEYERTLNENLTGQRIIVLCSYPVAKTEASGMLDVIQSHQFAIARRQGQWEVIESPEPIQAKAEIKRLGEELQRLKERRHLPLPVLSYAVAVLSVTVALFVGRWMQTNYDFEPFVLFLCAMMFSAWFGGFKPGLLALALSILAFHYCFLIPIYPLGPGKEIPRLLTATLTSFFVVWLSAAQRSKAESLKQAHDVLNGTVQDLRRVNVALRAENAERKQAEEALRQSEERFEAFMDNLPGYAWMKDLQGRYVYVNEMVRGLPGYRSLGKTDAQVWPADLAAEYRANDEQVVATKKPLNTLEHYQLKGKQRYMAGSKFPIFDKTGAVALVGGAGVDITERIEAEEALRESEERFRRLVELMPVAVYVCDTSGIIQTYNRRAVELWGREPKLGDPAQCFCGSLRLYSPEGELVPHTESPMAEVLKTGVEARDLEVVIERPDGSRITALVNIAPLRNAKGELIGAMNCFQDITERKRAEEAVRESQQLVRLVLETLPVGVSVTNRAGDIVLVNDASKRIWGGTIEGGRERWEQTKGYWHDSGQRIAPENWASVRALSKGETSLNELIDIENYDGKRKTIHNSVAPIRNAEGLIVGAVIVNEDVTDRVQAEKDLKEAHRHLVVLSRRRVKVQEEERRHLARELHDEIGQALTAAKINLQAAMKESDGAQLKRIDETAAILERLLGQVRQISLDLRPSMLDDLGLVPALRSLLDQQGRTASVAVHFSAKNVPENLDPEIRTTCFRIVQEAITNAVRHANATRIDVDLSRENGNLRLQVRDDGKGFDAESEQGRTVGLGLTGIKERAALVDARARIISSPNKGTTVEVSVPLTSPPERERPENGK